jgi:hypothetical protein
MQFSSSVCVSVDEIEQRAVTGNWFLNGPFFFFFLVFSNVIRLNLKALLGFAHQISGAGEVDGLATVESAETGN